ncbi:MAG: AMP-binding protein [Deltaproteobacteria bacterium]|nr:AMP-binding protein [Deltaproteobacteria bacterium]
MNADEIRATYDRLSRLTVWQGLHQTARRVPDKVAVVCGERRLTFADVVREAEALAAGLAAAGLRQGDVAAVYLPNSAELVTVFYALQRLGVVVAWLNPSYRETEARFILENSGAKAVFLFEEWQGFDFLAAVAGLDDLPALQAIVAVTDRPDFVSPDPRVRRLADLSGRPADLARAAEVGPDELSMIIYTSGTTGRSKGAVILQSQVVRAGWSYSLGVDATQEDVFIGLLPMAHSYGCGSLLVQPFLLGATLVVLDHFSAERAFALMERERVTLQLAAPAHYLMELAHPKRREYDLSSVRAGLIAGQIAPAQLITRVQDEMGIYISSFLGSSEVGPGLSIILPYRSPLEVREVYIGYPLEGTAAKVADPVTGAEKKPREPGELLLWGWHVTEGYWKNPEETGLQIRDGWLRTGDLVARDENGCFRILGRLKEWINRGGLKIIPSELESLLVAHPKVAEVCVVGTPNPILGESICACVKLVDEEEPLTLAEARAFVEGKVAPYKRFDELLLLKEFPRMPGGLKVNRFGRGGVVELAKESPDKQVLPRETAR